MALHLQTDSNLKTFTAYGPGYISVNGRRYEQPLVVLPGEVRTDWHPTNFAAIGKPDFDYFLELKPEVLLLGTGTRQQFGHPDLYGELMRAGIAVEFMDTAAACRTYNILVAEGRKVVAAVLPQGEPA